MACRALLIGIIVVVVLIGISIEQETTLSFNLAPNQEECLSEYFPEKTLVIYDISSNITTLRIVIKTAEKEIAKKTGDSLKHPFTTYTEGYYEACMENMEKINAKVTFGLKYGVAAKDYSSIARTKDLLPIDLELEKLTDRTKSMNRFVNFAQQHEHLFEASLNSISSKIALFSCILIGAMMIIGLIETIYLKKFMEKRKII